MMKLHSYYRSSASYRVRIALNLKGLPYDIVPVNLIKDGGEHRQPDYLRLNPMGQVPFLQARADFGVAQSMAILEYLEESHPNPPLLPASPEDRARVRQICEMINSGIQPIQNLSVNLGLKSRFGASEEQISQWNHDWIEKGLVAVEQLVSGTAGKFCFGDLPTLADALLVPQMFNARRFKMDLTKIPTLSRVDAACRDLAPFIQADPEHQPDTPRTA